MSLSEAFPLWGRCRACSTDEVAPFESEFCIIEAERPDFWRNNCKFTADGAHLISQLISPVKAYGFAGYARQIFRFALASQPSASLRNGAGSRVPRAPNGAQEGILKG